MDSYIRLIFMENNNLKEITIPNGWSAFYDASTKMVSGYSSFPKGGKAKTSLSILSAQTEAELLALCKAQGIALPTKK